VLCEKSQSEKDTCYPILTMTFWERKNYKGKRLVLARGQEREKDE
jgi:hypothetical protein